MTPRRISSRPSSHGPAFGAALILITSLSLSACDTVSRGQDMVGALLGGEAGGAAGDAHNAGSTNATSQQATSQLADTLTAAQPDTPPDHIRPTQRLNGGPDQAIGLTATEVQSYFGSPGYVRAEAPAQIWQYMQPNCTVDLFLYTDNVSGTYRVAHLELRARDHGASLSAADQQACFETLASR